MFFSFRISVAVRGGSVSHGAFPTLRTGRSGSYSPCHALFTGNSCSPKTHTHTHTVACKSAVVVIPLFFSLHKTTTITKAGQIQNTLVNLFNLRSDVFRFFFLHALWSRLHITISISPLSITLLYFHLSPSRCLCLLLFFGWRDFFSR